MTQLAAEIPMQKCSGKCGRFLPLSPDFFYHNKRYKTGFVPDCKDCRKDYVASRSVQIGQYKKSYNIRVRGRIRANDLVRRYGITRKQYDEMLRIQGGVCAICGKPETRIDGRTGTTFELSVDHDHRAGLVRGLLCHKCNLGFGIVEDLLESVVKYAKENGLCQE